MTTPTAAYKYRAEFESWKGLRKRCLNKRHKHFHLYGGRGIKVSPEWINSFWTFLFDVGPKPTPEHSIDRINNDGNYEPGNCRWATRLEQVHNSRRPVFIEHGGRRLCVAQWARKFGISKSTMQSRVKMLGGTKAIERCYQKMSMSLPPPPEVSP